MFRIVLAADERVSSPDLDGMLDPEEMEDDPDDPSVEFGRSTCVSEDSRNKLHASLSTTSLASALQASLRSSASLQEDFFDCVNDTSENDPVGDGNLLLDFLTIGDDGDASTEEEPRFVRSTTSSVQPTVTAPASPITASERTSSDGASESIVPASGPSPQVAFSARTILFRSTALVSSAAGLAVRTAFLPVTVPLYLTGSLLGRVMGVAIESAPSVLDQEADDEGESSDGSTQLAVVEGQYAGSSDFQSNDKLNGFHENDGRGWTVPLETAMKIAFLPVTAPMYLASAATSVAVNGCSAAVSTTASLLEQTLRIATSGAPPPDAIAGDSDSSCPKESIPADRFEPEGLSKSPGDQVVTQATLLSTAGATGLFGVSETMKDATFKVLTDLSFLLDSLSPSLRDTLIDPRKEDRMLDRLRLDIHLENPSVLDTVTDPVLPVTPACSFYSAASSITASSDATELQQGSCEPRPVAVLSTPRSVSPLVSAALLRVDDLGIYRVDPAKEAMQMSRLCYLDLNDALGTELGDEAMSRLIGRCLGLISNLPEARLQSTLHHHYSPKAIVDWKPERGSLELLGRLTNLSSAERLVELQSKTLVWSGQFRHPDGRGNKPFPFFASRGIIPWKPLDFVSLMWDDSRVQVYNKLCAGRSSVRVFRDEIDAGGSRGTKIVGFTTRVPLTNFTVSMTSLMHVAPIQTRNDDDAFVIVSRSVFSGRLGPHFESHDNVERSGNKSEIIWGVNIVQPVPNQPHLTDLTSISQVGTTMVPNILARKIGLWGVEDFYKNVRSHNS